MDQAMLGVPGQEGVDPFKRFVVGSFHKMSVKHMDRYLEELEWRSNDRNDPYTFRDALRRIMRTGPLEYKRLIA